MRTIVRYTDTQPPANHFPQRILSPTRAGPCCFSAMEAVGRVQREGCWEYTYRRCRTCGFTVRVIVRYALEQEITHLQKRFARVPSG